MTPAGLLAGRLAADPSAPLLTWYDDATGERVELSAATFNNWVAKSANLLVDGLGVEPGEPVALLLPPHWQTLAVLHGCWASGALAVLDAVDDARVVLAEADRLDEAIASGVEEIVGLSLRPLGGPLVEVPVGVIDYATEVPAHADRFVPASPVTEEAPALVTDERTFTSGELVDAATAGGRPGDRVLCVADGALADLLVAGWLTPLAVGGSVVWCRQPAAARLGHRADTERVTATYGVALAGLARLDG